MKEDMKQPKDIIDVVKDNITFLLKKKGWKRSELTARTPLSSSTLSGWFQPDGVQPSIRNLDIVGLALEASASRLLARNDLEALEAMEDELITYFANLSEEEQEAFLHAIKVVSERK